MLKTLTDDRDCYRNKLISATNYIEVLKNDNSINTETQIIQAQHIDAMQQYINDYKLGIENFINESDKKNFTDYESIIYDTLPKYELSKAALVLAKKNLEDFKNSI